jgi:ferric-dicitrate binding protein FerR (iron transport regulator)
MSEPVHVHAPHELTEESHSTSRRERLLELTAVLLLSAATVCIAWSGYQAAKWSGHQARHYAQASTARALANRAATLGGQERIQDLLNFNRWLEVSTEGNDQLAQLYERRFRAEFVPAFNAWVAQDPLHNTAAIPTPLLMPQYKLANLEKADALEQLGDQRFEEAKQATENADRYIFVTVLFAAVLFFAGISMRFNWLAMRLTVLGLSAIFLGYGIVRIATLPTL